MALHQLTAFPIRCNVTSLASSSRKYSSPGLAVLSRNGCFPCQVRCTDPQTIARRSGNYPKPYWDSGFVQSLTSEYEGEEYKAQANKLQDDIRMILLEKLSNPTEQLELIDYLQRLGLAYRFEDEINNILKSRCNEIDQKDDLYATSLRFRLLRQHGYNVPQEVFNRFKDEQGNFKRSLCDDIKGLLNLYEASYFLVDGEGILEEARDFAKEHLKEYCKQKNNEDQYITMLVNHSLELPLHWRTPWVEARWLIDAYERKQDLNPILLEFAKLHFNIVQAVHMDDVRHASRWWTGMDLGNKLFYARDRMMENTLWTVGQKYEPEFGRYRKMMSRFSALVTILDDAYDVYATLEELEVFTDVTDSWDINALDRLPYYLKLSFFSLHQSVNEIGYDILKEQGINVVPALKKLWSDLCGGYLKEAKWYNAGYKPSLQEYLDTSWMTISGQLLLGHGFLLLTNPLTEEAVKCFMEYPDLIRYASTILRLANDLATSSEEVARGDNPKSTQCYMHETGATEEEARDQIRYLINETWKKLNKERFKPYPFSETFMKIPMNLARTALCFYEKGDGYGMQGDHETYQNRISSMFVKPIPLSDKYGNHKPF